ncbi:MAG: DUF4375 domain-containing protein [Hyphomonadaceae bacterium]
MGDWPSKLELTADRFDQMDGWDLLEHIGPWMMSVFDVAPAESPRSFQLAASAYWIWADVGNGGLRQYLRNSACGLPCAVESLRLLKRDNAVDILAQAIALLPSPALLDDIEARRAFIETERVSERLSALDDSFWEALDDETFPENLAAFARSHRSDFEPYFAGGD